MEHDSETQRAVNALLALVGPEDAARLRERTGVGAPGEGIPEGWAAGRQIGHVGVPASAYLWMLETDDPEINALVYRTDRAGRAVQRDIRRGLPFAPGARGQLPVSPDVLLGDEPEGLRDFGPDGVVPALRRATTMRRGRAAADAVQRADWERVVAADAEQALPGYARWALALRIDCPDELRERFSGHPGFAHKMRWGGIVDGPATYALTARPARDVLALLETGRWAFPARLPQAQEVLRPLVHGSLGTGTEAWAVLAQLLPTFTGTVPELIVTAGAIA
ncbi:hypothetical protein [Streptomyces sp. NPDC090022]|uniref:hypothetical protein n=1 Tax=Streptomyces sp. NPDC090022 TaxID=3365920 RepID=UPI003821EB83